MMADGEAKINRRHFLDRFTANISINMNNSDKDHIIVNLWSSKFQYLFSSSVNTLLKICLQRFFVRRYPTKTE